MAESERRRQQHWGEEWPENPENYLPVSLLSTPPTITTTRRPYGEIVNKDFFDKLRSPATKSPVSIKNKPKNSRQVSGGQRDVLASLPNRGGGGEQNLFPLGGPQPPPRRYNFIYLEIEI